jgi:hypothetical protein
MSTVGSVAAVAAWERIRLYPGVPKWWAEVLTNVGLSVDECESYVLTASADSASPLSKQNESDLNASLRAYASARGIMLLGAGCGDGVDVKIVKRSICGVSTVATAAEQSRVEQEVGEYADVRFKDKVNGTYTEHAVANAVRSVHQTYGRRLAPAGVKVLEPGASMRALILAGVDPSMNHGCCPVLDLRDGVRHSITAFCNQVVADGSGHCPKVVRAARAALDPESGFFCRRTAQECSWKAGFIFSNQSTHDIPFGDLPNIMARHGARTWVGFMARAKGLRRGTGISRGACPVMGTRWVVDEKKDTISFHFAKDACFSYTHRFSEWVKYDERVEYRWYGRYYDYVYSRLPITTDASLAFMVSQVPKSDNLLRNPVYLPTGLEGLVKVTSIKVVGGCIGVKCPKFEPMVFSMERLAFDKVMENRLMLGVKGNLATTIAYMRSVRVRMFVNGVALGATQVISADILESAAVAVEALAFDSRERMDADNASIMRASTAQVGFVGKLWRYFSTCAGALPVAHGALRTALLLLSEKDSGLQVSVEPCAGFSLVEEPASENMDVEQELLIRECGCEDYADVLAALEVSDCLGRQERIELERYKEELIPMVEACLLHSGLDPDECEEEFFDAQDVEPKERTLGKERFSDSGIDMSGDDTVSESESESDCIVYDAVKEYAEWAAFSEKAARSEAEVFASVLFMNGNPTADDVERATVPRTRHAVVAVIGGEIRSVVGSMQPEEVPSELYSLKSRKFFPIFGDVNGQRYVKECITELCYTSSLLCILNGERLSRSALQVLQHVPRSVALPRYTFVNGVPGCGKTTEIKQLMCDALAAGRAVMYLTATSASASGVLRDLQGRPGLVEKYVRTFDSFLCGSFTAPPGGIDELYCDEVPMMHAGAVYASILRIAPTRVRLYGDFKQITFQSFTAQFEVSRCSMEAQVNMERRVVTHRFGAATCAMWLDVYGEIYPCDCCDHQDVVPSVVRITSASQVPVERQGKLLCFTQEERSIVKRELGYAGTIVELKRRDKGGLSTVAEDQGGTHDAVVVVRTINKKNPKESVFSPSIYNRQPWVLVASTRHRQRLVYYTASDGDLLSSRIGLARCAARLEAVRNRVCWDDVKDGAMPAPDFGHWSQVCD